jgi:N-acetylmuramoyl-L-alanine amidase
VEGQFKNKVGRVSRGVKQAGFVVLWRTTMPSVLIETGFLSNTAEEDFLATEQGQDLVASGIYRAFKEYKNEVESIKSLN